MRHRTVGGRLAPLQRAAAISIALLLAACASTTVVREEPPRRSAPGGSQPSTASPSRPGGTTHVVQAGDTLYGIAFRNGLDWREVARWNNIGEPYTIRPGQTLRLGAPRAADPAPSVASGPPPIPRGPAGSGGPAPSARPSAPVPTRPAAGPPSPPPSSTGPTPPVASRPAATPPAPAGTATPAPVPASTPTGPAGLGAFRAGQWQWPTQGQVISRYAEGDKARQGIAIAGTAGQPVRAAAAGTVVYSGAGLVGYGELIIIKHSDEWLSAYGHNRRRLVAEGASISAGQQIAELGRTGTSRDMLHFEIRRNGKPVDPMPLLPRR